jgi:hypothetical protein
MHHVGDVDRLQGLAHHAVDTQPVVADAAVRFDAAHAAAGTALGESEGLVFERVDDVGNGDVLRRPAST